MAENVGGVEYKVSVDASGAVTSVNTLVKSNEKLEQSFEKVDSSSRDTEKQLKSTSTAAKSAASSAKILSNELNTATKSAANTAKSTKNLTGIAGQLGYQVQDIAVQLQMGTNALVVFGQQGSQIAGAFGPKGAIVGGIIAVAAAIAGPLVMAMQSANDEMQKLPASMQKRLDEIKERFTETGVVAGSFLRVEIGKLNAEYDALSKSIKNTEDLAKESAASMNGAGTDALAYASKIESLKEEQRELAQLINAVTREGELGLFGNNAESNIANVDNYGNAAERLTNALKAQQLTLSKGELEGRLFAAAMTTGAESVEDLDPKVRALVESVYGLEEAQKKASDAARQQAREQRELDSVLEQVFRNQEKREKEQQALEAKKESDLKSKFERVRAINEEEGRTELESIRSKFEQERIIVAEHYALMMEKAAANDEERKVLAQQTADELTAINRRQAEAEIEIEERKNQAKRQAVSGALNNISQLMNTESRKSFEIGKMAAKANALLNAYDSANEAYKGGLKVSGGNPAVGAAFAATALAATFAQVRAIESTQFGSAGTGQSFQGGQVVNNTGGAVGTQEPSRNVSISLTGDNFGSGGIRGLIDEINEAVGDGVNIFATGG